MKQRNTALGALALYAMLAAALLVLALLGAGLYARLTAARAADEKARATLAYLQSRIQAADAAEGVVLRQGPEGDAVALRVEGSDYWVTIFCAQGSLYEQTGTADAALSPAEAQPVADCGTLEIAYSGENPAVLVIRADGRQALAALRSGEAVS
jgi:type II secretory pathway pseudopilin PulG